MITVATGAQRRVDGTFNGSATPLWAPDSRSFEIPNLDGSLAIVTASSGRRRTLIGHAPGATLTATGWSPNSDHLVVTENSSTIPTVPELRLLVVRISDGHVHDLGSGSNGSYAPDGQSIAYANQGQVLRYTLATGKQTPLAPPYYPLVGLISWSADGQEIAYSEGDNSFRPIVLTATPTDGAKRHIFGLVGGFSTPIWARNQLIWSPLSANATAIAITNPTSGHTRLLRPLPRTIAGHPIYVGPVSVLPGGTRIVYAVSASGHDAGLRSINVTGSADAPLVACRGRGHGDLVIGTPGNDVINVRNGSLDTVSCLGGTDTVIADRRDHIGRSCEHVRRT